MYDGLLSSELWCNTGIFRTRGIFRTLNIYDGKFYSQPCVTLVYLQPWHIQNPKHIQNTAKHVSRNILFKTLCITLTYSEPLVYSEIWYFLKSQHIQKPAEYLRSSILLRTLCNYSRFRGPTYSKLLHIQNRCVLANP